MPVSVGDGPGVERQGHDRPAGPARRRALAASPDDRDLDTRWPGAMTTSRTATPPHSTSSRSISTQARLCRRCTARKSAVQHLACLFSQPSLMRSWVDRFRALGRDCHTVTLPGRDPIDKELLGRVTLDDCFLSVLDARAELPAPTIVIGVSPIDHPIVPARCAPRTRLPPCGCADRAWREADSHGARRSSS